jgi:hypothetical protein
MILLKCEVKICNFRYEIEITLKRVNVENYV